MVDNNSNIPAKDRSSDYEGHQKLSIGGEGNHIFNRKRHITTNPLQKHLSSFLRFALPTVAILLVISVLSWPTIISYFPESAVTYTAAEALAKVPENTASKPQFNGVDRHDQPYVLIADHGVQMGETDLFLTNPQLTLHLKSGASIVLKSEKAHYNKNQGKIQLTGTVVLTHTLGYTFKTSEAWIDLSAGEAYGTLPVDGVGPTGLIQSPQGFKIWDKGDKIKFLGRSELIVLQTGDDKK